MWIKREEVVTCYELVSNFMKLKLSLTALEINGSTRTTFRRRDGHLRKLYISRMFWRSLGVRPNYSLLVRNIWNLPAACWTRKLCMLCIENKVMASNTNKYVVDSLSATPCTSGPWKDANCNACNTMAPKVPPNPSAKASRVPPRHQKQGCQRVHGTRLAITGPEKQSEKRAKQSESSQKLQRLWKCKRAREPMVSRTAKYKVNGCFDVSCTQWEHPKTNKTSHKCKALPGILQNGSLVFRPWVVRPLSYQ